MLFSLVSDSGKVSSTEKGFVIQKSHDDRFSGKILLEMCYWAHTMFIYITHKFRMYFYCFIFIHETVIKGKTMVIVLLFKIFVMEKKCIYIFFQKTFLWL